MKIDDFFRGLGKLQFSTLENAIDDPEVEVVVQDKACARSHGIAAEIRAIRFDEDKKQIIIVTEE